MICHFNDEFKYEERLVLHHGRVKYIIKKNKQDLFILTDKQAALIKKINEQPSFDLSSFDSIDYQDLILEKILLLKNPEGSKVSNFAPSLSFWVHVTDACNLACDYCYISTLNENTHLKEDLFAQLAKKLLQVDGLATVRLKIAGGEPFYAFEHWANQLISFIHLMKENGIDPIIQIITNLTILTNSHLDFIKKHNIHVAISLDGLEKEHDRVRFFKNNQKGSFEKIKNNLTKLKSNNIIPIVLTTVSAKNKQGIQSLVDFLITQNIIFRLADAKGGFIHIDEFTETINAVIDSFLQKKLQLSKQVLISDLNFATPSATACPKGVSSADIYSDGKMYFCHGQFGKAKAIGSLYDDENILQSIKKSRQYHLDLHESCYSCAYRFICAGGCPLYRINGKSPMCNSYQKIIKKMLTYYEYENTYFEN